MMDTPYNKQQTIEAVPRITRKVPFLPKLILENWILHRELRRIKYRISELEDRIPGEKVIILKNITREEAKGEIERLFKDSHTLCYSDIAKELKIDLETVVDICKELMESGAVEVDARVS